MKHQRSKQYRKILNFYSVNCGFRPPYHVLVDGEFVKAAAKTPVSFVEHIANLLGGKICLHVTACALREAEALHNESITRALGSCEVYPCPHGKGGKKMVSSIGCYSQLVSRNNPQKLMIASGQTELIRSLKRKGRDVPVLVMHGPIPGFEKPSEETMKKYTREQTDRILATDAKSRPPVTTARVSSTKKKGFYLPKPRVDSTEKNRAKRQQRRQRMQAALTSL